LLWRPGVVFWRIPRDSGIPSAVLRHVIARSHLAHFPEIVCIKCLSKFVDITEEKGRQGGIKNEVIFDAS